MTDIKEGDMFTIEGVHRLPDGSLKVGKPHKKHRQDKMPVFTCVDVIGGDKDTLWKRIANWVGSKIKGLK